MHRFLPLFVVLNGIALVPGSMAREVPALTEASQPKQGIPSGNVEKLTWDQSRIFPGTERAWAVYTPAQLSADKPANAVIFLDGSGYLKNDGHSRATVVLDNLIGSGEIPPTVGIFVDPGSISGKISGAAPRSTRSFEYDSVNGSFAKFLAEEIIPEVRKKVNLRTDAAGWAICGISSSAIAAFTAAWERPDLFGNVISYIGSYTNIRGGYVYPALIRASREKPKALRLWMQEGESDLDNLHGHWPLANADMAAALRWAGYEHHYELTGGGHSGQAGGALLPQALKWAFQPAKKPEPQESPKNPSQGKRNADAEPKDGVPQGEVIEMPVFQSTIYPKTERQWWVYVPPGYKPDGSAGLMVFQDGAGYQNKKSDWAVPTVLDNLIAQKAIPPMVAVFINPGHDPAKDRPKGRGASNRSAEYDSLGERYARFLLEEILPEVEKKWPVSKDPEQRGICGASSGGICAFTVAWERPDQFRRVLSTIGSFVNLRGGNAYPYLIRKTERKPLRIFLSDTSGDLDNPFGHWPLANQQMHASLAYMGYDVKLDWAEGYGHNSHRGGEVFSEAMRWLWRAEKTGSVPGKTKDDLKSDFTLNKLLVPNEGWTVMAEGLGFADGLSSAASGHLFFNDLKSGGFWQIAPDGTKTKLSEENGSGAKIAPDGRWIFCQGKSQRLVAWDPKTAQSEVLAQNVNPNDLVISTNGWIYFTQTKSGEVIGVELKTKTQKVMAQGITAPNGIALSPDGGTLAVSEYRGTHVWAWRVNPDGTLDAGLPYMTLRRPVDATQETTFNAPPPYKAESGGDGMCSNAAGQWFITSALGVQVFDPTGRECGLLEHPAPGKQLVSVTLAGPGQKWLCVAAGDKIFRRVVQ